MEASDLFLAGFRPDDDRVGDYWQAVTGVSHGSKYSDVAFPVLTSRGQNPPILVVLCIERPLCPAYRTGRLPLPDCRLETGLGSGLVDYRLEAFLSGS